MINTAPSLLPTIVTPLAAIEPTRLKDNVDCLRLIIGEFTLDHEGNPVLSTDQKQLLIAAQFAKALAGNEAMLIHLGSTMAGQSKTDKVQHEAVVPLKQYSREQLLVMIGQKMIGGTVINEAVVARNHKHKNDLDVTEAVDESSLSAVVDTVSGSGSPPVRNVGYREIRDQHSQQRPAEQLQLSGTPDIQITKSTKKTIKKKSPLPPQATPVEQLSSDELLQMHRKLQRKHGPKRDE